MKIIASNRKQDYPRNQLEEAPFIVTVEDAQNMLISALDIRIDADEMVNEAVFSVAAPSLLCNFKPENIRVHGAKGEVDLRDGIRVRLYGLKENIPEGENRWNVIRYLDNTRFPYLVSRLNIRMVARTGLFVLDLYMAEREHHLNEVPPARESADIFSKE